MSNNPEWCSFCGVYADNSSYCTECMDKLELFHKQEAIKRVLEIAQDFKDWNCCTSEKITVRALEFRLKKEFSIYT